MYRAALLLLTLIIAFSAQPPSSAAITQSAVSLNPSVTFAGGSPSERTTVVEAVDRYVAAGLALPDLSINIHTNQTGCADKQGLFRAGEGEGVIDLCFDREFLVLHELGHAWVQFNLEELARETFLLLTEAPSWSSSDTAWHRRGSEIAANALAHGLLSVQLESVQQRTREFAQFRALTGRASPRLTEIETAARRIPATN